VIRDAETSQKQIQVRPPEKAGGRYKFKNKGNKAGGTPALQKSTTPT
jgi:hypothetical protein